MNRRQMNKPRPYLVSYHIQLEDGRSGFGDTTIWFIGAISDNDKMNIREVIGEKAGGNACILNIVPLGARL